MAAPALLMAFQIVQEGTANIIQSALLAIIATCLVQTVVGLNNGIQNVTSMQDSLWACQARLEQMCSRVCHLEWFENLKFASKWHECHTSYTEPA